MKFEFYDDLKFVQWFQSQVGKMLISNDLIEEGSDAV
jgi:hypothetical protein